MGGGKTKFKILNSSNQATVKLHTAKLRAPQIAAPKIFEVCRKLLI
jgi:hypothetical protein